MTAGDDVDRDLSEVCLLLRALIEMLEALSSDLGELARDLRPGLDSVAVPPSD